MSEDISRLFPLSRAQLYILLSLSSGEKHGYAVMLDVQELSEGTYKLGPATLYENIARLLAAGAIAEVMEPRNEDERRRYYRLTSLGNDALQEEVARLGRLVARMELRHVE